ncbi:MAG TPA: Hpt domain-containing protein, partial [Anaerolineales bacterium]|nr:Hpt domain-containing protein [Anaerolineales bacterium]
KYGFQTRAKDDSAQHKLLASELPPEKVLDVQKGIVQIGGDENMYRELLSDFIKGLPKRLRAIQNYFAEKDLVELSRTAHNLSGIAANLGASQLSDCAKKLDKQSVEGYTESLDPLVQEIQLVIVRLLEFSNTFLAEKQVNAESA